MQIPLPTRSNFRNLKGQKFTRLRVLGYAGKKKRDCLWKCECDCGNQLVVLSPHLIIGSTQSCGCLQREITSNRSRTHGMSGTRIYNIWCGMIKRTTNVNCRAFRNYGGRGINVCDEWLDFLHFHEWAKSNDYDDTLSLDRIDNDRNYCPENCRWVSQKVQTRNTRRNRSITIWGETKLICEWLEDSRCKVSRQCFYKRRKRGWSLEEAISKPSRYDSW